jgi:adenylate cyclase
MAVTSIIDNYYPLFVIGIILIAVANVVRAKYFGRIKIQYPGSESVTIAKGTTILEASRIAKIPHQSVCGGKGRCTTCRVKVISTQDSLPAPNTYEKRALDRIGLEENIRLACQLRPSSDLSIIPLVNPHNSLEKAANPKALSGKEKETAILFIDLRGFTKLSEKNLAYDVVYILNKYYSVCGKIIESNFGRLDKFIGDGIMAIFDSSEEIAENCRNAVKAASQISENMKSLNGQMKIEFSEDIRFGMGIHAGDTIVGLMGYGKKFSETAVGDNVNVASRLEELSKKYACELVISQYVAEKAKLNLDKFNSDLVEIRGRKENLKIFPIHDAAEINF